MDDLFIIELLRRNMPTEMLLAVKIEDHNVEDITKRWKNLEYDKRLNGVRVMGMPTAYVSGAWVVAAPDSEMASTIDEHILFEQYYINPILPMPKGLKKAEPLTERYISFVNPQRVVEAVQFTAAARGSEIGPYWANTRYDEANNQVLVEVGDLSVTWSTGTWFVSDVDSELCYGMSDESFRRAFVRVGSENSWYFDMDFLRYVRVDEHGTKFYMDRDELLDQVKPQPKPPEEFDIDLGAFPAPEDIKRLAEAGWVWDARKQWFKGTDMFGGIQYLLWDQMRDINADPADLLKPSKIGPFMPDSLRDNEPIDAGYINERAKAEDWLRHAPKQPGKTVLNDLIDHVRLSDEEAAMRTPPKRVTPLEDIPTTKKAEDHYDPKTPEGYLNGTLTDSFDGEVGEFNKPFTTLPNRARLNGPIADPGIEFFLDGKSVTKEAFMANVYFLNDAIAERQEDKVSSETANGLKDVLEENASYLDNIRYLNEITTEPIYAEVSHEFYQNLIGNFSSKEEDMAPVYENSMQTDVAEFHKALGHPAPRGVRRLPEDRKDLRIKLIEEELQELREALDEDDVVETVDAAIDILYVTFGLLVEMGVDAQPLFDEVQRSNLSKLDENGKGILSRGMELDGKPLGKGLKGPNYFKPDLGRVLIEGLGWKPQEFSETAKVPTEWEFDEPSELYWRWNEQGKFESLTPEEHNYPIDPKTESGLG